MATGASGFMILNGVVVSVPLICRTRAPLADVYLGEETIMGGPKVPPAEQIAQRAFELYLERGGEDGHEPGCYPRRSDPLAIGSA